MNKLLNFWSHAWPFVAVTVLFIVDKISKYWALQFEQWAWPINDFFTFSLYWNTGISFSLLAPVTWQYLPYILTTFAIAVATFLMIWQRQQPLLQRWGAVLIAGGAVGNGIDRLQWGAVADFISLHYYDQFYWPTFNLADSFITIGVILFLYQAFFGKKKS